MQQQPNGLLAPPQAPPGYKYTSGPDGRDIEQEKRGLHISPEKLVEALLSLAPGSGEIMDAQGSIAAGRDGWNSLRAGDWGDAAGHYAESITSGLGAVPLLGIGARGICKGAHALAEMLAETLRMRRGIEGTAKSADAVALPGTVAGIGGD
jgi:hypothetical protein